MRILWLTWKDKEHPLAGGAEVVSSELGKRLVKDGHEVIFITGSFKGAAVESATNGYKIIRLGNRYTLYWKAYRYIKKNLLNWPDIVIEEVNTLPFFSRFYLKSVKRYMFFHMLCRKVWFYQMKPPLSWLGFIMEPLYLRLLRKDPTITVSESTKKDLMRHGFTANNIAIISEGIQIKPVSSLSKVDKFESPTIVSLGAMRAMKRTLDQISAFEIAKIKIPNLQLKVAGDASDAYGQKVLRAINESPFAGDIEYLGRISQVEKQALLQKSHAITVTSVKEGWGLIVTEAGSQGTPAVVYDVDGLRDSVRQHQTGLISRESPPALAKQIINILKDKAAYKAMQHQAWLWSKEITFEKSYTQFTQRIGI